MTNIVLICHDIPSMSVGATLPLYHMIKELGNDYKINLISFDSLNYDINDIKDHLNDIHTIAIPQYLDIKKQLLYTLKNMISFDNIKTRSLFNYYYNSKMSNLIKKNIENADVIITDMPMAFYVKKYNIPKIVYAFDAVSAYNYDMYTKSDSIPSKIYWYLNYLKIHRYEKCYNNFDSCIVVNDKDKRLLKKDVKTKICVIPNGVDTQYFKNTNITDERLVFLGDMSTPPNNDAVKYFVEKIYPLILDEEEIKLYIVGRNPSEYIKNLDNNPNIIVTGSVDDVRGYLTKNAIFITPMISGTGIKNKILEAMSMQLSVVSTSKGISGINAKNYEEYLLADDENTFKDQVLKLLNDKKLNESIGHKSRRFVEENYSWSKSMKLLINVINNIGDSK